MRSPGGTAALPAGLGWREAVQAASRRRPSLSSTDQQSRVSGALAGAAPPSGFFVEEPDSEANA